VVSDLQELTSIIEQAKTNGSAPITITGDMLLAAIQFAGLISGGTPPSLVMPEPVQSFPSAIGDESFMSIDEVCDDLRIGKNTLWRMRKAGDFIPEIKLGERRIVFRRSDLTEWKRTRQS
jgi:excisionase family DNA binding protein